MCQQPRLSPPIGSPLLRKYAVNPFSVGVAPPKPTGLASYGVLNHSGSLVNYTLSTHMLVGTLDLASIGAYYPNASTYNVSAYGASLQLNSMLVVRSGNTSHVYWVQNVVVFQTNLSQVFYADNIWNMSGVGAILSNSTVRSDSGGYVVNTSRGAVYGSSSYNYTYLLPLSLEILEADRVVGGLGVQVEMGIRVLINGTVTGKPILWYDNATLLEKNVDDAYFLVDGGNLTPPRAVGSAGLFYDAELVLGGEANGSPTNFTALNATLGLYYEADGRLNAFPSYYSFGDDTAEAAYDLHVEYLGNGTADVSVGQPNYVYLNRQNQSTPSTTPTINTSGPHSSNYSETVTTQSIPQEPYTELIAPPIIVLVLVALTLGVIRLRRPTRGQAADSYQ